MNKYLIALLVSLVILAAIIIVLYITRCNGCTNGCKFTMGIFANQCKCEDCKTGVECDKYGNCMCPPKCLTPNGECQKDGSCVCKNNYTGNDCTTPPQTPSSALEKFAEQAVKKLKTVCPGITVSKIEETVEQAAAGTYKFDNVKDAAESIFKLSTVLCTSARPN